MSDAARHDQASQLRALVSQLDRRPTLRLTSDHPTEHPLRRAPMLAIASGKGGVGKTTLSVNVSIALAQRGLRVTLVDADLGLANADVLCGLLPQRRLEQAMGPGGPSLEQLLVPAPGGFRLVPGAVGVGALANLDQARLPGLLRRLGELDGGSDVIILDTSAGIGAGVLGLCAAATMTMVVATPEPTSVTDAYALLKCLACQEARSESALFINQAEDASEGEAVAARIDAVAAKFLGALPRRAGWACRDDEVSRSIRARTPLLLRKPGRRVSRQIGSLAGWIASELRLESRAAQRLRRGRPRLRDRSVGLRDVGVAPIVRRMSVERR